ncbi:DUF6090 family protein [Flavobacteriaceae bacterium S0862]|nr:DUF6090 family protein [Flavobacteriaceae bacterium S0862]
MIKFFRHIRYNFMETGKTGKYLKYAIGEIILVVIGILIALSINNWNEEKKSIKKSREILFDIKENVEFNTIQFQEDIEITNDVINSIDIILNNINVTKIYNDSLDKHFRRATYWETSRWKSSGYEAIISHGVEIIQSKELRESIIDLYEISYPEIAEYTRLSEGNFPVILPKWLELIERESIDFSTFLEHKSRPFDYQEIIESRIFRSILTFLRSQRLVEIQLRNSCIEKNQELIELIDKELLKK